jgi:hypothetical protein
MTAVYSDIAQYIADGKTPLQIVDLLRAESVRQNNLTQWSFGLIETQLDASTARTLAGVIQAAAASDPLMASAFTAMSTTGIELWSDARQAMIDTIGTAAGMTLTQIAQVKALGVTYTAVDADATIESVQSLIDAEAERVAAEALETEWSAHQNEGGINTSVAAGNRAGLVASLRLAANALEGV